MDTLITSIVGIQTAQRELKKHPTEKEQRKAMEMISNKAIISTCFNVLYFVGAVISAGLIHWAFKWFLGSYISYHFLLLFFLKEKIFFLR